MKLKTLAENYNYTCYWCKRKWPLEDLSRDHIEPLHRNGRMVGGGERRHGKCVLACITCNALRGNMPFDMFERAVRNKEIILK